MPKQAKNLKKMRPAIGSRLKKAEAGKLVYKIDCSIPLSDDLITADTMGQFATYLAEHIKIEGKTGRLGELVKVGTDDKAITIACREVCVRGGLCVCVRRARQHLCVCAGSVREEVPEVPDA